MSKPTVTRTYGPIHFEDLDPHRFEDLIRELIYDFKNWHAIEATGRSGGDDGYDIRAYERAVDQENTDAESDETASLRQGNVWMIQVKREKEIGPTALRKILSEIDAKAPPYGYILAASAHFSKDSYDAFHEELRAKGVMEFYLWGKPELEDMLHFPKNDRILFTFFGISLVSRRRSRATEIRASVGIKNKLFTILPKDVHDSHVSVLIRDVKDTHYPYEDQYKDFAKHSRWREFIAYAHHPLGIWTHNRKYYAYVDTAKKEWDFTPEADLLNRTADYDEDRQADHEKGQLVRDIWEFLPLSQQGWLLIDGFVPYEDILLVDKEGDTRYQMPHLYVDFSGDDGPFRGGRRYLEVGHRTIPLEDDWKRVEFFPKRFSKKKTGKVHKGKPVTFDAASLTSFKDTYNRVVALYATDDRFDYLNQRDIVEVVDTTPKAEPIFIQITSKYETPIKDYLDNNSSNPFLSRVLQQQLGREYDPSEVVRVLEFKRAYKWEFEKQRAIE